MATTGPRTGPTVNTDRSASRSVTHLAVTDRRTIDHGHKTLSQNAPPSCLGGCDGGLCTSSHAAHGGSDVRIVVIGGTGLIGSKLVAKLTERGHEAIAASPDTGVNTLT